MELSCLARQRFDREKEIADLTRAIQLNPQDAKYYYARGYKTESLDEKIAAQDFKRVLDLGYRREEPTWMGVTLPPLVESQEYKGEQYKIDTASLARSIKNALRKSGKLNHEANCNEE